MTNTEKVFTSNTMYYLHPDAEIGENVTIQPFAYIGANVKIGNNTKIGPHVTILEGTTIGNNCQIFPGAVIGAIPQDLKYGGEETFVEIGDNTIIREYATINKGTSQNIKTVVGSNCLLMAYTHVAHDCEIGDYCILANCVNLAGHVILEDYVTLEGLVAVQQFVHIGQFAFVAGGSLVRKNVPPYVKGAREPLSYIGVNAIGLKRRGFSANTIRHIEDIYRLLYVKGYSLAKGLELIEAEIPFSDEKRIVTQFVKKSTKGIMKGFSPNGTT